MEIEQVVIYTDGACRKTGQGGWAFVASSRGGITQKSGHDPDTTNNRMEIQAVIEALKYTGASYVMIVTDSQYVQKGATTWRKAWERSGWIGSSGLPVLNRKLWEELYVQIDAKADVEFKWVRGHSGDPLNEMVDKLAVEASRQ